MTKEMDTEMDTRASARMSARRYFWIVESAVDANGEPTEDSFLMTTPPGAPPIPTTGDISLDALRMGRGNRVVLGGIASDVVGSGWFVRGVPCATRRVIEITKGEYDAAGEESHDDFKTRYLRRHH